MAALDYRAQIPALGSRLTLIDTKRGELHSQKCRRNHSGGRNYPPTLEVSWYKLCKKLIRNRLEST